MVLNREVKQLLEIDHELAQLFLVTEEPRERIGCACVDQKGMRDSAFRCVKAISVENSLLELILINLDVDLLSYKAYFHLVSSDFHY